MESIQGIIVGAEVLGHVELPSDGAVEHATERDTIDRAGMDAEPYDAYAAMCSSRTSALTNGLPTCEIRAT